MLSSLRFNVLTEAGDGQAVGLKERAELEARRRIGASRILPPGLETWYRCEVAEGTPIYTLPAPMSAIPDFATGREVDGKKKEAREANRVSR